MTEPVFKRTTHGSLEVQACFTNRHSQCLAASSSKAWSTAQGNYTNLTACTRCHSNIECVAELYESNLGVRYTCYRDLGSGTKTDASHPKWEPLLTDKKDDNWNRPCEGHDFDIFIRVWNAAFNLRRISLYNVLQDTSKAPNVRLAKRRFQK